MLETLLQDASILQLTEALASKSDQLELSPGHLRSPSPHKVGDPSSESQDVGKPELSTDRLTSPHELTATLLTLDSRISSTINQTRPISRLPPEVLAHIFGWYQRVGRYGESYNKWYKWVHLMSVSQAWRSTILSFPSLWSRIYVGSEFPPKVIRTLLQRSGSHPLDLTVPVRPESASRLSRRSNALEASKHMSRIRKLSIYEDSGENDVKHLLKIFSKPAPNLTHLLLAVYDDYFPISVPNWFGSDLPNLRKLEVGRVKAWPEAIGTNLTHIVIKCSLDPPQLIRCLQYSPSLKVLEILGVRGPLGTSEPQRITLPSGIHLAIKNSPVCPDIVGLFSLPSDSSLQIETSFLRGWAPAMTFLLWTLPPELDHLQNLHTITRLRMKALLGIPTTRAAIEVKCFRGDLAVLDAKIEFPKKIEVQSPIVGNVSPAMVLLNDLDGIVLRKVEELRMEGFFGYLEPYEVELLRLLTRMPVLVRVVTDNNQEKLRSALNLLGRRATVVKVD